MDKKGRIEIQVLVILIVVVITSALILFLVRSGTIKVKEDAVSEPVLNTEFLPLGKDLTLSIKDFSFCSYVDENLNCEPQAQDFDALDNIYVRFVVQSSLKEQMILQRNYRIRNPLGEIVLQADPRNTYDFEASNVGDAIFADFFVLSEDAIVGRYTLDIIVTDALSGKKVTLTKDFMVTRGVSG